MVFVSRIQTGRHWIFETMVLMRHDRSYYAGRRVSGDEGASWIVRGKVVLGPDDSASWVTRELSLAEYVYRCSLNREIVIEVPEFQQRSRP